MALIPGTNGNDNLVGTADPDTFTPLLGSDTVDGLGGSDLLVVDYSGFSYDPYAGATVPQAMTSNITSSGGAFGGTVRTTYGGHGVTLTSIENLQFTLNVFNDVFIIDAGALALGGTLSVDGGSGYDRFEANLTALDGVNLTVGQGGTTASFGTVANFEIFHLTLGSGADVISTGNGADILNGGGGDDQLHGGRGYNQLRGEGGDDQLIVNLAIDTVDGGTGTDTLVLGWSDATRGIYTEAFTQSATGYSGHYYESNAFGAVERLAQFTAIERFVITAGSGWDFITTGNGNDWVAGNAGNDSIDVGSGNDTADGGAGEDRISADLSSATGAVVFNLVTGSYSGPTGNFTNFEGLGTFKTGSGNDEVVTSSLQIDETVQTGAGDDKITFRNGWDKVDGGAGADLLVIEYSGVTGSVITMPSAANLPWGTYGSGYNGRIDGGGPRVDYSGIERFDITVSGGAYVDLQTGMGNDRIVASGSGGDRIAPGGGADYVDAGTGTGDVIDYSQRRSDRESGTVGVVVNLAATAYVIQAGHMLAGQTVGSFEAIDNWGARDTILGIEGAESADQDDVLLGSAGDNSFSGWGGNDRIVGGAGFDNINGGDGVDLVDYSAETGTSGVVVNLNESLFVTAAGWPQSLGPGQALDSFGNMDNLSFVEQITTGGYNDRVYGNNSVNLFRLGSGDDDGLGYGGNDHLIGEAGNDKLFGGIGDDRLEGGDDSDTLLGDPGNDILEGGSGNDLLNGGTGDDTMAGGAGNDVYVVDSVADILTENAGEGTDEIRTSLTSFSLLALTNFENLTATSSSNRDFRGNGSNNVLTGGGGNDFLRLQDGGNDTGIGGGGNDVFLFGSSMDGLDSVDGGGGLDQIALQGGIAFTFGSGVVGIESIGLLSGADTRFGGPGGLLHSYGLTTVDANVAAGVQLTVDGAKLLAGENLTFNGSAETDGSFFIYGGRGVDILTGGSKNDVFLFGSDNHFGASDVVNGGPGGTDQLALRGSYSLTFGANQLVGIESLGLLSAQDTRFGALGSNYSYNLTTHDNNVASGVQMTVDGAKLRGTETLVFNGSAETDGSFRIFGGLNGDTITGSQGADILQGHGGADMLTGGGGADTFRYASVSDSSGSAFDRILDFAAGTDKIDLSRIDADSLAAGDQAFSFIGSNAFSGSAGQLRAYQSGSDWFVEGDINGDGNADLVIQLGVTGGALTQADFLP